MSAEKLHDALNQLPDDLIAATDALRQRKKQPAQWRRLVPIAACFALILGALSVVLPVLAPKGSQDAAPEAGMQLYDDAFSEMIAEPESAAPAEPAPETPMEQPPFTADESDEITENSGAPLAPEEEERAEVTGATPVPVTGYSYCIGAEEPDETAITVISTAEEWQRYLADNPRLTEEGGFENSYEEAYFEENQLIVLVTTAGSSSVRYEPHSILKTGSGTWELTVKRYSPEWFTDDMTQQCILVELPRMVEPEDTVTLNFIAANG